MGQQEGGKLLINRWHLFSWLTIGHRKWLYSYPFISTYLCVVSVTTWLAPRTHFRRNTSLCLVLSNEIFDNKKKYAAIQPNNPKILPWTCTMWNFLHIPERLQIGHLIWEKKPTLLLCSLADKINFVSRTLKNTSLEQLLSRKVWHAS